MLRFAANLSMLYTELPFLDRFEAAARDGFKAVEFWFPYGFDARELAARLQANGLQQVLINAPPAGMHRAAMAAAWDAGERGTLALPGREAEFRAGVLQALDDAHTLGCPQVHVLSGIVPPGMARESLKPHCVAQLQWAAQQAAQAGVRLLIEPINQRDMPRYFLNRQDHAHELIEAVASPHVQVLMDIYHCQVVEGDITTKLRQYLPTGRVGHIQIAGVPARQEPDQGELNMPHVLATLDALDYSGWIGCEYRPAHGTQAGLGWLRQAQAAFSTPSQAS